MPLCRFTNADSNVQFANYRDGQIQPVDGICDRTLFSLTADELAKAAQASDAPWQDAPAVLLPPTPVPEKVICIGLNYLDHAIETGAQPPSEPIVFSKFNTAIVGHGDEIRLPEVAKKVDYEAEMVVVIGRTAKNVVEADALDYVFGYTCGNDVSARDWQKGRPGGQWLLGKTFDTFAPVGPCVVPVHEFAGTNHVVPGGLRIQLDLNGESMQDSTTEQLIFAVPALIAHLSKIVTLNPGDLIFTGTPPGVGMARKPPVFLKPGDVCSVTVEGIGTLTNPCVAD